MTAVAPLPDSPEPEAHQNGHAPVAVAPSENPAIPMRGLSASDAATYFFLDAAKREGIHPDVQELLKRPYRELTVEVPVRMDDGRLVVLEGFRVQHSAARGPYKGGVRFHPDVDRGEIRALAALMDHVELLAGTVHTRQEFDFRRAVTIDEPLTVRITVASHSERRGALIAAFQCEIVNAAGEPVGGGRATVMVPPEEASS